MCDCEPEDTTAAPRFKVWASLTFDFVEARDPEDAGRTVTDWIRTKLRIPGLSSVGITRVVGYRAIGED